MTYDFENWSGAVKCTAETLARPDSIEAIQSLVLAAHEQKKNVRVIGSGHSFTALVKNDQILVTLDEMQGLEDVNAPEHTAVALAGTKLHRLNGLLDEEGLAMSNLGDINKQSIAGALGTGTHGTGAEFGVIASQVEAVTFVNGKGEVVECSRDKDPDTFRAAQVSLGALGILAKIKLKAEPAYNIHYVKQVQTFDLTGENLSDYRDNTRNFEFFFFPHTETVLLKFLNASDAPPNVNKLKKYIDDVILENVFFGAASMYARAFPSKCAAVSRLCARFVSESEQTDKSYETFSTSRLVRFNEMEYAIPAERGFECLREIKDYITDRNIQVHFPIEFRFVKGDDILLSPAHDRDTVCISLHMYQGMPYQEYFAGAEEIFKKYEGRPHWGKMHTRTGAELSKLYPEWDKFQAIRKQHDPDGVFMTPYLRELLD